VADALNRAGRCRDLAKDCHDAAASCSSTEMRDHCLQMEEHYRTLAQAEEFAALAHTLSD
jgi:hypothetical protein